MDVGSCIPTSALRVRCPVLLLAALCSLGSGLAWAGEPAAPSIVAGHIVNVAGQVRIRKDGSKDTKDIRMAKAGDVVMVGDIINTPSDGKIKLLLKDRSLMDIGPSSLFKLNAFKSGDGPGGTDRQVESSMAYGSLRAAVTQKIEGKGHFKVRSPSATMGVRGTEFAARVELPNDMGAFRQASNVMKDGPARAPAAVDGKMPDLGKTEVFVMQGSVGVGNPVAGPGRAGTPMPETVLAPGQALTLAGPPQMGAPPPQPTQMSSAAMASVSAETRVSDQTFVSSIEVKGSTKSEEKAEERKQEQEKAREQKQKETAVADGKQGDSGSSEGSGSTAQNGGGSSDQAATGQESGQASESSGSTASASNDSGSGSGSGSGNSSDAQQTAQNSGGDASRAPAGNETPAAGAQSAPAAPAAPAAPVVAAPPPMPAMSAGMASFVQTAMAAVNTSMAAPVTQSAIQTVNSGVVGAIPTTAIVTQPVILPNIIRLQINFTP